MSYFKHHFSETDCDFQTASNVPLLNQVPTTAPSLLASETDELDNSSNSCLSNEPRSTCSTPDLATAPPSHTRTTESQADLVTKTRQESREKRGRRDALKKTLRKSNTMSLAKHFGLNSSPISSDLDDASTSVSDVILRRRSAVPSSNLSCQSEESQFEKEEKAPPTSKATPVSPVPRRSIHRRLYRGTSLRDVLDHTLQEDRPGRDSYRSSTFLPQERPWGIIQDDSNHTAGAVTSNSKNDRTGTSRRLMMSRQGSFVTGSRIRTLRG